MIDDFTFPTPESRAITFQIGAVCVNWAGIDRMLGWLLAIHMKAPPDHPDIVTSVIDLSRKCELIKALSFLSDGGKEHLRLAKVLNILDNELRSRRNRYVHDSYYFYLDDNVRISLKTHITKVQSFTKELRTSAQATVTEEELVIFNKDLCTCAEYLLFERFRLTKKHLQQEELTRESAEVGDVIYADFEAVIARYKSVISSS